MTRSTLMNRDELLAREPDLDRLHDAYTLLSTDFSQGAKELEELANKGSVMSMLYLAQAYHTRAKPDPIQIEKWYRHAYEAGSATGLFGLGTYYYNAGRYNEAEKVFSDGASKNDGVSMFWLAHLYASQDHPGKSAEIRALLEKSMALGQIRAKRGLGSLLIRGKYGIKNIPKGLYLILSSAVDGFKVGYHDPHSPRLR